MINESTVNKILNYLLDNMYYEHAEETALITGRDIFYIVESEGYRLLYSCEHEEFKHIRKDYSDRNVTCYKALHGLDAPCKGCSMYNTEKGSLASWITNNDEGTDLRLVRSHITNESGKEVFNNITTNMSDMEEVFRHMQRINASRELVLRCMEAAEDTALSPNEIFTKILKAMAIFYGASSCYCAFYDSVPAIFSYSDGVAKPLEITTENFRAETLDILKARMQPHTVCFVDRIESLKSHFAEDDDFVLDFDVDRLLLTPIFHNDNILGYIIINDVLVNKRDIPILSALTDMIGAIRSDISHRIIQERIANTDSLTGALNFDGFKAAAAELIKNNPADSFALMSVDIRDFRNINDFFGYETGDDLLKFWVNYENHLTKDGTLFCRISADTFCFFFQNKDEEAILEHFENTLSVMKDYASDCISETYILEMTAGCYFTEENDSLSLNEMFNRSHMARNRSKNSPGSKLIFYDKEMHNEIRFAKEIEIKFSEAVATERVIPFFQPQMCLSDRAQAQKRIRAEALARWINPDGTVFARPDQFIPILEKTGQIAKLDHFIFRNVCKTIRELKRKGVSSRISVNVSRNTMFKPGFTEYYEAIRQEYNISYEDIILEFTESISVIDMEKFSSIINRLRKLGFVCSMDDFGSDYSSLNNLHLLYMDELKLDRAFFTTGDDSDRRMVIVDNTLQLSHDLKMESVAEGIETDDMITSLKNAGCDYIQGYVYAKPMPKNEFIEFALKLNH